MIGLFKLDKKRYKELTNSSIWKENSALVIFLFRLNGSIKSIRFRPFRIILNIFFIPLYRLTSVYFGISIPRTCKIGGGLIIFHNGGIVFNPLTKIGNNCTLRHGVTIGNKNRIDDVPVIGDNVNIGVGAVIIGDITIGNNVDIGANAVVVKSVPDNNIAIGIPAKNILKNNVN